MFVEFVETFHRNTPPPLINIRCSFARIPKNRDVLIVTTLDTFTSLIAGITIFGILGNLAHNMNLDDISSVVKSGAGLAFISYPDAISKLEFLPQVCARRASIVDSLEKKNPKILLQTLNFPASAN